MPALYPAFFFVLEKAVKSAGNEVIPTYPMHRSHGLQGSLKRRYKHPSPTSINGYHTAKKLLSQSPAKRPTLAFSGENGYTLGPAQRIAHNGSHAETGAFPSAITARLCAASEIPFIPPCFYIHTFPGSLWPLTIGRREKVSEDATATLSPTIPHCVFQLRSQMAHVRFHERKWVHTRLRQQDRTQRLTRRNRGVLDGGAITTLGAFHTFRKPCVARCQNGKLCRFWGLVVGAPKERRKPSEQRCAYAHRCSEGVAAPPGRVIFSGLY